MRPLVVESVSFLHKQLEDGKNVLVEGANAAMLDIDFGETTTRERFPAQLSLISWR